MKRKAIRYAFWLSIIIVVVIQGFQIDRTNPQSDPAQDFLAQDLEPAKAGSIIKKACFDCHSNYTRYPWYTYINPVGWWIKDHVDHGKHHLNFSEWNALEDKKKKHKLEECVEMLEEKEMPLPSYILMHDEADLSGEDRELLISFFRNQMNSI